MAAWGTLPHKNPEHIRCNTRKHKDGQAYLRDAFAARGQGRLGRLLLPCNPKLPGFPGGPCCCSRCNCRLLLLLLLLLGLSTARHQLCWHPLLLLLRVVEKL